VSLLLLGWLYRSAQQKTTVSNRKLAEEHTGIKDTNLPGCDIVLLASISGCFKGTTILRNMQQYSMTQNYIPECFQSSAIQLSNLNKAATAPHPNKPKQKRNTKTATRQTVITFWKSYCHIAGLVDKAAVILHTSFS
jgi:hypothetical protein